MNRYTQFFRTGERFQPRQPGKHELTRKSSRFPWRLRTVGVVTAIAMVFAIGGGAAATTLRADHGSNQQEQRAQVNTTIHFSPATQAELRKLESTPQGR